VKPSRASPLDRPGTAGVKGDGGGLFTEILREDGECGWMDVTVIKNCLSVFGGCCDCGS